MRTAKKQRLTLNRETLRFLDRAATLAAAAGRGSFRGSDSEVGVCDTVASCTELAEDCCVLAAV